MKIQVVLTIVNSYFTVLTFIYWQRWIKKRNYRKSHAKRPQDVELEHLNPKKITPWQLFLTDYGESDGK